MIDYPYLREQATRRETVDVFGGYNHNLRIGDGEFYDMENLSSDHYPVLSPRKRRAPWFTAEGLTGIVHDADLSVTYFTRGSNLHRGNHINQPVAADLGLSDSRKRFVRMGVYLIILPDMKYFNLRDSNDRGDISASVEIDAGEATYELCDADGTAYTGVAVSDTEPEGPEDGALWLDTSATPHSLKQYSVSQEQWASVASTYIKIKLSQTETPLVAWFRQYDGVTISGSKVSSLNGYTVLYKVGGNYVVVPGILDEAVTQDCTSGPLKFERKPPLMDHVIEAGNRLWGCRYGENAAGEFVNEIYCSKLGDFRNWSCFMGISTDSWAGSVGSEGPFTGAVNHGGNPVFYKENMKHKVWVSSSGAHQITNTPCQGVQNGCGDSMAVIDGILYYKSRAGFCADGDSMPVEIGQVFGGKEYRNAVALAKGGKYYVSMEDKDEQWHLFVYDTLKKLWHREDGMHVLGFCDFGAGLLAADADTGEVQELTLGTARVTENGVDLIEGPVRWMAETGSLGISSPDMKYISRLTLRLSMDVGAELTAYAQYDMEPEWVPLFSLRSTSLRSFSLPVRPRRCDHMRLRLEGEGDVKLYSITKVVEEGSDLS